MIEGELEHRRDLPAIAAVAATVLWGVGNVLAAASTIPGPQLAFWRTLCGATVYQAVFHARGGRMSAATFRAAALGGLAFGGSASLFFTALKTTTVASASVISALQPVMLLPVSAMLYGERTSGRRLGLVLVTFGGTVLVVLGSSSSGEWSLWGDVLALLGTIVGCLYFVGTKSARETLDTLEYQAAALVVAAGAALPGAVLIGDGFMVPSGGQWFWPLIMTAVPGTGHLLMSWAQRSLTVSFTATVALAVVVVSSLGAALFFDQPLSGLQLVGMAIVLVSLAFFVRNSTERLDPLGEEL